MLKSKALKGETSQASVSGTKLVGGNVTSDVRAHYMRVYRSLSVNGIMTLLYPRMLAIHDLASDVGFLGANGKLKLPAFMRTSYAYMVAEGAYLLCKSQSPSDNSRFADPQRTAKPSCYGSEELYLLKFWTTCMASSRQRNSTYE
jgi:hypothetical protein